MITIHGCHYLYMYGSIITYTDDTCLLFSHKTWDGVYEKAHQGFRQINNRLKDRNLILNVEITVFMPFSLKKNDINYNNITIHDSDINKICDSQNCKSIKKVEKIR